MSSESARKLAQAIKQIKDDIEKYVEQHVDPIIESARNREIIDLYAERTKQRR